MAGCSLLNDSKSMPADTDGGSQRSASTEKNNRPVGSSMVSDGWKSSGSEALRFTIVITLLQCRYTPMANIYDVAKAARVSVATVSAVLNDTAFVSPALKARVQAAVAALRYHPN